MARICNHHAALGPMIARSRQASASMVDACKRTWSLPVFRRSKFTVDYWRYASAQPTPHTGSWWCQRSNYHLVPVKEQHCGLVTTDQGLGPKSLSCVPTRAGHAISSFDYGKVLHVESLHGTIVSLQDLKAQPEAAYRHSIWAALPHRSTLSLISQILLLH